MDLKDKLDLLWKYLLLLVIVVGMCSHLCYSGCGKSQCGSKSKSCKYKTEHSYHHGAGHHHEEYEDIQIQMEVDDGDTLLNVTINGKELTPEEAKIFMAEKEEKGLRKMLKKQRNQ